MESNNPRKQWAAIKNLKKKRSPNFTKLKDEDGNRVGPRRRAEAIADFLEEVQWKEPELPPQKAFKPNVVHDQLDLDTGPIDMFELDLAICKAKANKSPGPDNLSAELFKILDYSNRNLFLSLFNRWWVEEKIPEEHVLAQVVTIKKKEKRRKFQSIDLLASLMSPIYVVCFYYSKTIGRRHWPHDKPYSVWLQTEQKYTARSIYVARRLQDISEQSRDTVILTLLDWEKAFDRVAHPRLIEALERMSIPEKLRNVIAFIPILSSVSPMKKQFQHVSTFKTQAAGIRQGCPLSPYLFVLVMTVMFRDIHADVDICNSRLDKFSELLYADDTLLVAKNTKDMNLLLHSIEKESKYYGLKLNETNAVFPLWMETTVSTLLTALLYHK